MIKLKRLNGIEFVLNCDYIETVEATPDTIITLFNGRKYIVSQSVSEVVDSITKYKKVTNSSQKLVVLPSDDENIDFP